MAIGDPWDTSYNPDYQKILKNKHTGEPVWMPDNSDNVPQDDPLSLKDRRKGRFCSEGCGCIDTGCSNLAGSTCVLPPEIAVTIFRGPDGRYQARSAISGGEGETFHLKYSNGSWRGSKCCSHNADGPLEHACDPCKVTTLPNGKPSECHYANNKYKSLHSSHQEGDKFPLRGDYNHERALDGKVWPRKGVNAWLKPQGYNTYLNEEGTDLLTGSVDEEKNKDLIGSNIEATPFSSNAGNARINIKAVEKRIYTDKSGYIVGYSIDNGYNPDEDISDVKITYPITADTPEGGCIEDGAIPIKKRPWCRTPIDGYRIQQQCSDTEYKNKEDCEEAVDEDGNRTETWLYGDKTTCQERGVCEAPEEDDEDGVPLSREDRLVDEVITSDACVEGYKDGKAKCKDVDGKDTSDEDEETCAGKGHIWHKNRFFSNDWVDWEYERRSCCGGTVLDEAHPFHTPQISGMAQNTRKNTVCFTPYSEVILTPDAISGFAGPLAMGRNGCMSIGNQADRDWFFFDQASYWTLLIRPCNFWGSCYEEGVMRKDPSKVSNPTGPDNYYETTCGEEVVLFLPIDQFMNCSNFNLTLSQEEGLRSGWIESEAMWNPNMGNPMGNPAGSQTLQGEFPLNGAVYGQKGLPGDAIEKDQHEWWCDYPDAGWDGIADGHGTKGECQRYVYWNSNDGAYYGELQNPKGVDAFYAFNIQPQPFKATEEKQSRAKSMQQAANDKKYWQMCVGMGLHGGGGHWFWDYGPDYFFYFDFALWDEVGVSGKPGTARQAYIKPGGKCEEISKKAAKWINSHIGHLGRGSCPVDPPLWVGWIPQSDLNKTCPQCFGTFDDDGGTIKTEKEACGKTGRCTWETDGYFRIEDEQECTRYGRCYDEFGNLIGTDDGEELTSEKCGCLQNGEAMEGTCRTGVAVGGRRYLCKDSPKGEENCCKVLRELYRATALLGVLNNFADIVLKFMGLVVEDVAVLNRLLALAITGDLIVWHPEGSISKESCLAENDRMGRQALRPLPDEDVNLAEYFKNEYTWADDCCDKQGGTFEYGNFTKCCMWIEGCTYDGTPDGLPGEVITGYEKNEDGTDSSIAITRPANGKEECLKEKVYVKPFNGGAEAKWFEECVYEPAVVEEWDQCPPIEKIPDGFLEIVLGEKVGTCTLFEDGGGGKQKDVSQKKVTESHCETELKKDKHLEGSGFKEDSVGSSDVSYPVRENLAVTLSVDGPQTKALPDVSVIENGKMAKFFGTDDYDVTEFGLTRNRRLPAGGETGHSLSYWHNTGLFPRGEMSSFVNDHCMGTTAGKRIEYASNTKPITITSRNNLLKDGDLVNTWGVNGNFGANVTYSGEWQETQWEDKIYSKCVKNCDKLIWPLSECPETTVCLDKDGKEIEGKDRRGCLEGTCKDKREDGSKCIGSHVCIAAKEKCIAPEQDGTCKEGFKKDRDWKFDNETGKQPECGEEDSCCKTDAGDGLCVNNLWETKDSQMGCGSTWDGQEGNTFSSYCDHDKYYACTGAPVMGVSPPPADFFVAKNVTIDTFDLYTCDKHPVDGTIQNKENLDNEDCPDDSQMVCVSFPGLPYNQIVTAAKFSITKNPDINFGLATIGAFTPICVDLDGKETDDKEKDCTGEEKKWITERNLTDNPRTEKVEGESFCSTYGSCKIVDNYFGIPESFMKKDECITLAKTFNELFPDKKLTDGAQKYVNHCQDLDGNRDNSEEIISKAENFDELEKACKKKHSKCIDPLGNDLGVGEDQCVQMGGTWKEPYTSKIYNECVDEDALKNGDENAAYKACWDVASWMSEAAVDQITGSGSGSGVPSVGVWKVCPYTGTWVLYNNQDDPGVEAGYISHLGQDYIDSLYRFGFGGPGYKWEDRANDYYVQIEQKGICPVCCDNFMPKDLTATITGESSEILNIMECGLDPCTDSASMNMKPLHDGWCCSDPMHPCDMGNLEDCKKHPDLFGKCFKDGVLTQVHTKEACLKMGRSFTPIVDIEEFSSDDPSDDCNMFLRKRPVSFGATNCRRCSDVYSSRHKVPLYEKEDIGAPLDYWGESCCDEEMLCKCTTNDQDHNLWNASHPYPDCTTVRHIIGACGPEPNPLGTTRTVGEVTAVCTDLKPWSGVDAHQDWVFTPCSCFPRRTPYDCHPPKMRDEVAAGSCDFNGTIDPQTQIGYYDNRGGCFRIVDGLLDEGKSAEEGATEKDCGWNSEWKDGATGCNSIHIMADADESCYNHTKAHKPVNETCPGLGSIDVPLKYDGVVWRSEWELMNTVGTHHCDIEDKGYGVHRFKWAKNCRPTGSTGSEFISGTELVAVNADCDACDMPQYGGTQGGVMINALKTFDAYRNAELPSLPQDGHFIRLVMGCGATIPSIDAYGTGRVLDGGFSGGSTSYRENGINIWAEITNCVFTNYVGSESLKVGRSETGVNGAAPCFPGSTTCISKKDTIISGDTPVRGTANLGVSAGAEERKYTFAGKCMSPVDCGPKGPCINTECCTYTGRDMPLFISGPLWSGAVACSQGGDIDHICKATGFDPLPKKPAEGFTVHYVKDIDAVTGEATLVVPAYAPTFGGARCSYPAGTPIGIGLAELAQAEKGGHSRSNKSRNPYLPAGGTTLTGVVTAVYDPSYGRAIYSLQEGIPRGDNPVDKKGDAGRGNEQFMEIKVANIAPLITKNPRKNRHLRIYDRSRGSAESGFHNTKTLSGMNMKQRYDLPQPYGLNPWPVDHQTHSSPGEMWPKGIVMGPDNTESLRKDPALSLNQPGRVGPLPTIDNLNRMFRFTEEATGDGSSTPMPELWPVEPVMINEFHNVYSEEDGFCTGTKAKDKKTCKKAGHIWVPNFLYTKVVTHMDNDLSDGEKVIISGSVTYPATCKGARMGYCKGNKDKDINECMQGECVDTQLGADSPWIKDSEGDVITNPADCSHASEDKQREYEDKGVAIPDLVFKSNGEWIQIFEEGTGGSFGTSEGGAQVTESNGTGDKHVCENVFGGTWIVGRVNDEQDDKGFYTDPLNAKPIPLEGKEKDFNEGCPVGCRLNGFYLKDPCQPPSKDFPQGQCFECIDVGQTDREEMRCPLGPADGGYVARKRGCQHADYSSKKDCENAGWAWFGELENRDKEFALHNELQIPIHDASKLRSNSKKPNVAGGIATDWEYDLSNTPKTITTDAGFTGASNPVSSLDEDACNSTRGAAWSSKGCVDLSRLDVEFGFFEGADDFEATAEIYELCSRSNNCHFIKKYKGCMDMQDDAEGRCLTAEKDIHLKYKIIEEALTREECKGVFIGPSLEADAVDSCLENEGAVMYQFECKDPEAHDYFKGNDARTAKTTTECTDIAHGTVVYSGRPQSISLDKDKINMITRPEQLIKLSSPEAIAMGHEVGIGLAERKFTGVIYAEQIDQKENDGFSKVYADPPYRAVWSRHGGSFDIIIGYPAPENNCRQANSDKPVNMDFYLNFPSICCNDKGPLSYWACDDKCYHHYYGPVLTPLDLQYGVEGNSVMKVNIHE